MRFAKVLAITLCAALLFCACGKTIDPPAVVSGTVAADPPPEKPAYPVSFDDETFEAAPVSVASLSPALTEILFDIGAADHLIAVSDYCDYPSGAQSLPTVGSPANPDIEAIISLAPELLLAQSHIAETDKLLLKQAGIRVLEMSRPNSFAELCEVYIKLSMVFRGAVDSQTVAWQVLSGIDSQMSEAQSLGISKSFVIVEAKISERDDSLMLSRGGTLCSEMLSVFGYNLWEYSEKFTATDDELFELAPEVVFYASGLDEQEIKKVFPHSQLIEIDFERFERPTVRISEVIAMCAEAIGR